MLLPQLRRRGAASAKISHLSNVWIRTLPRRNQFAKLVAVMVLPLTLQNAMADGQAPDCSGAIASPVLLSPPNHEFQAVEISGITDPNGQSVATTVECISQDEPLDHLGDGNTIYDGKGIGGAAAQLRSERAGNGNGRVYHIDFLATNSLGLSCAGTVTVGVPHHKWDAPVDEGRLYHSAAGSRICAGQAGNTPPVIMTEPVADAYGLNPYHYQLAATDADDDALSYLLVTASNGMVINAQTGLIEWTPLASQSGDHAVTVRVQDGRGGQDLQTWLLTVHDNRPPQITSAPVVVAAEDNPYHYAVQAADPDQNDTLTFGLQASPPGMNIDAHSGVVTWLPGNDDIGAHAVTLYVTDNAGNRTEQSYTLTVENINDVPVITSTPITQTLEDTNYQYAVAALDPDAGETLQFSLAAAPGGMQINPQSGVVSWFPDNSQVGDHAVTVQVEDSAAALVQQNYTLTVINVNDAPVITSEPVTLAYVEGGYRYDVDADDVDVEDTLTFALLTAPPAMAIDPVTGAIDWSPAQPGDYTVEVEVTDSAGDADRQAFNLTIEILNTPPSIQSEPASSVLTGQQYRYQPVVSDPDGDTLAWQLVAAPQGTAIDPTSGEILWTPTLQQIGEHELAYTVSDGKSAPVEQRWFVTVGASAVGAGASYLGREFWIAFNLNYKTSGPFSYPVNSPDRAHWLSIAAPEGASGTVEAPGLGFSTTFDVAAGGVARVDLPDDVMMGEGIATKGVHVVSDRPVAVVATNFATSTTDALLAFPVGLLGQYYTIADFYSWKFKDRGGQFSVLATQDNTAVKITPRPRESLKGFGEYNFDPVEFTLNAGQIFQYTSEAISPATGFIVETDKPVTVTTGSPGANVPFGYSYIDYLGEQLLPDNLLGTRYLGLPHATRLNGEFYRFVATRDDTTLRVNDDIIAQLDKGEYYDRLFSGPLDIRANRPIHVLQASPSTTFDDIAEADPFLIALPATGIFASEYIFSTPQPSDVNLPSHYISIGVPEAALASLRLDGASVDTSGFQRIHDGDYFYGALPVDFGAHTVKAALPFMLIFYGYGDDHSYGTVAGAQIQSAAQVAQIEVTSNPQQSTAGDQTCVEVILLDQNGNPVPYAPAHYSINGVAAGVAYSDGYGRATACYTGAVAGSQDSLAITSGLGSASAGIQWVAPDDGVNRPPAFLSQPDINLLQPTFRYTPAVVDPNGEPLTLRLENGPPGMALNAGELVWTPPVPADRAPTEHNVTLVATDSQGLETEQTFTLHVTYAPLISRPISRESVDTNAWLDTHFYVAGGAYDDMQLDVLEAPAELRINSTFPGEDDSATDAWPTVENRTDFAMQWQYAYAEKPETMSISDPFCSANQSDPRSLQVSRRWRNGGVIGRDIVADRIKDTNQDGQVDQEDTAYAFALEYNRIALLNLTTGAAEWTRTGISAVNRQIFPAMADINGDGKKELFYANAGPADRGVVALDSDGNQLWRGWVPEWFGYSAIIVTDLENDGAKEIIVGPYVFDANGTRIWQFDLQPNNSNFRIYDNFTLVVDLDGDGNKEVLSQNQVRASDGTLLWTIDSVQPGSLLTGQFAAADLDGDGSLEVVATVYNGSGYAMYAWRADGTPLWGDVPVSGRQGLPIIADFDRDGELDILHPGAPRLINKNGEIVTELLPARGATNMLVADLNGDGQYEQIEIYNKQFVIRDLLSGYKWGTFGASDLYLEEGYRQGLALIDTDNDGSSELVMGGALGTALYQSATGSWRPVTRGTSQYFDPLAEGRHTGIDILAAENSNLLPDLWIGELRINETGGGHTVSARVRNRGAAAADKAHKMKVYRGERDAGGVLLAEVELFGLGGGGERLLETGPIPQADISGEIFAYLDPVAEPQQQCEERNDSVSAHTVKLDVYDAPEAYRHDTYTYTIRVAQPDYSPSFVNEAPFTVLVGQELQFVPEIHDNNIGDRLRFSLTPQNNAPAANSPQGPSFDLLTGEFRWSPGVDQVGNYRWVLSAADLTDRSDWQYIDVAVALPPGSPPQITSAAPSTAKVGREYQYQAQATDPDGDALTYSLLAAPDGMVVTPDGLVTWAPAQAQLVTATVQVSDGLRSDEQTWSIDVLAADAPMTVDVTATPAAVAVGNSVTVTATVSGVAGDYTVSATLDGAALALDGNLQATLTPNLGNHTVVVTAADAYDTATASASFLVSDGSDTVAPVVSATNFSSGALVTEPVTITGGVAADDLAGWRLYAEAVDGSQTITLAAGDTPFADGPIAAFDPTLLTNGQYRIVLEATDTSGNVAQSSTVVRVTGDLKVGLFSIAIEDLSVPVAGIPITVTRTYDSRRRSQYLDFGYGWSIDYRNIKIEENRAPGQDWQVEDEFGIPPVFCVRPKKDNIVTITLPNGKVEQFRPVAIPECAANQPTLDVAIGFEAIDGTQSQLVPTDNNVGRLINGHLADPSDPEVILDPNNYQLTTRSGYIYILNQAFGIDNIVDPNGNTLIYSDQGIEHSSGKRVQFERNGRGLITAVIDPAGNRIAYAYDGSDNLATVTDASGATTTHTYNGSHGLIDLFDPLGRKLLKNIYNQEGRLIAQEDGDGNRTEFNHDLAGRQSIVTDRNGHTSQFYYDERGNITSQVDALGNITTHTYDAQDNQLSQTNPLGHTQSATFSNANDQLTQTDALGNTVSFGYSLKGYEISVTDARGNRFENSYDSKGNLLTVTDPENNMAANTVDPQGLVTRTQDVLGNSTDFTYDGDGNKLTETDALGNITSYTYDANGNVLTETRSRTLADGSTADETTRYEYDARNRLIKTTDALGHVSQTEYNLAGDQVATVDAVGKRTEYTYDAYRRLLETRYPDGTTASKTWDPEGNLLTDTDRAGRITRYEYDAADRLIKTTYPDGSLAQTEYDAANQVVAEVDGLNRRTEYEYDAAGRRVLTRDAQGNEHRFEYDADGNLVAEVDALGRRTEYTYNSLDQRTQTTWHNNSVTGESFDALSRRTGQTDQAGVATQYAYDALGRLVTVTDAQGNATTFTYDQAGNKLTQTDAEGRTTQWEYDALGRVTARQLPLGQRESFAYDAAGNVISHTDFAGNTTLHLYDDNHRKVASQYADGVMEAWAYTPSGQVATATREYTDGSTETWAYQYDDRGRLIEETKPDGTVLAYQYDLAGNRTQVAATKPDGSSQSTSYTYDSLNRLQSVTDAHGVTTYGYDAVGNRTSVSQFNGASSTYSYDNLNRLTSLKTYDGGGALAQSFDYTLHATGRRTQIDELGGRSTAYTYDAVYRLTGEQITDAVNGNYSAAYQYDKVGNRTYSTIDGVQTAYSYDANDRLLQQGGTTYTYDASGNTLSETLDGGTTQYHYNGKNKLTTVTKPDTSTAAYTYNINGVRTGKTEGGVTTRYIVDENRDYAQVVWESNGTENIHYTYGDDLISQNRDGSTSVYHYDGLGSTRGLSDATGSLTDTYRYEAFGQLLGSTGTTENDYLFAGEQFDQSLNQYYLRARYYNQGSGRFTQMDSWQGINSDPITLHKYLYANADPVNYTDPTGNFGLGSFGVSLNIQGILTTINVASSAYDIFQIATGEEEFSFRQLGTSILLSRLPVGYVAKLAKRFKAKTGRILKIPCARNSFIAGTLIHTRDGLIPIEEVEIGDWVLSFNEETGEQEYQQVIHLIQNEDDYQLVNIEIDGSDPIVSTLDHPFYVNGQWKNADELSISDQVSLAEGSLPVVSLSRLQKKSKVYNFTVENTHTYYVGGIGSLVHNASDCIVSVANMDEFFGSTAFGALIKSSSKKLNRQFQNQSIFKVAKDSGALKKGYHYYLDNRHKNHFEVFDGRGKFKFVMNLDGTINKAKSAAAQGRSIAKLLK